MTTILIAFFDNLETLGLICMAGIIIGASLILIHALWKLWTGY